jgi:hypothetical protein
MPLLYSIQGQLVLVVVVDRVTFEETVHITNALLADPGFEETADLLVDASRGRPSLSYAEMRITAARWPCWSVAFDGSPLPRQGT